MPQVEERRERHVFVVSDATGATCEMVVKAALSQFEGTNVLLTRAPGVRTEEQILETVAKASMVRGVVVFTIASAGLREAMSAAARDLGVPTVDILGPILTRLSHYLEISPLSRAGLFRQLDEEYYKRMEAVDFTVKHDDGLGLDSLGQAEIVLVGVSRASKTPVSLYLSFRGWKVANIPLALELPPPHQLDQLDPHRIIGLTVDPPHLRLLRLSRQRHIGAGVLGNYVNEEEIRREVLYARRLFVSKHWPEINTSAKSIEETATEVLQLIHRQTGQMKGPIPER